MTLSVNALTTLAKAKSYLKITDSTQDTIVEDLIERASDFLKNETKRKFAKATYTEKKESNNTARIMLDNYPVTAITSCTYNDTSLTLDTDYELEAEAGILYKEDLWYKSGVALGLSERVTHNKKNVTVVYTAGYVLPGVATVEDPRTLPFDIEQACILMVQYYYKTDIANFSTVFGEGGQVFRPSALPSHVKVIINNYRKRRAG